MFDSIIQVLSAFWHQDFTALMAPGGAGLVYFVVAALIFLESGFIPAAPFPCDSVVVLSGTLAAVGVGSWAAYLQGKWLNRLPKVQGWVSAVPQKRLEQVDVLLSKHGLIALFCARFIPVVRSLLPLMMGLRVKRISKFHYFAWLSAILWTLILCGFGLLLPLLPENMSKAITMLLMAAPIITLVIGVLSFLFVKARRAFCKSKDVSEFSQ
jgi:membrane protein DedA with SNARE-associated domain